MKNVQKLSPLAAGALLLLCGSIAAVAQPANGNVRGTVTDQFGGIVPQAEVTFSNGEGIALKASSDGNGRFDAERLAAGRYTVRVEANGLVASTETIVVKSDVTATDDFVLQIADDAVEQVNAN